jgi:hypothetical protein
MAIEPDYRTLKAIEEAKATAVPAAAASLAAATGGVVVQADVF